MNAASLAANPFALIMDSSRVRQMVDQSEQLSRLSQRQCHPLDKAVIRSASAELAAFDAKIDRTTVYLPPEEEEPAPLLRRVPATRTSVCGLGRQKSGSVGARPEKSMRNIEDAPMLSYFSRSKGKKDVGPSSSVTAVDTRCTLSLSHAC